MSNIEILQNTMHWVQENEQMSKTFDQPIQKVLELTDGSGMVVVLEPELDHPYRDPINDAFIIDATGEVRAKICIPQEIGIMKRIYDVYYAGTELLFVVDTKNSVYDIACHFNEHGEFIRRHFTK